MNAKANFLIATSAITVFGLTLLFVNKGKQNVSETTAYIKPPISGVNVEYSTFEINTDLDTIIEYKTGSKIVIPANAFLSKSGNVVKGIVKLKYREFNDAIDIILSGIPMNYDSAGVQTTFESAGMFEISAFKNKEALNVNPSALISVNLNSTNSDLRFNKYFLDTIKKRWNYIARDIPNAISIKDSVSNIVSNKKSIIKPTSNLLVAPQEAYSRNVFDIEFDNDEFPELSVYKNVKFQVCEDDNEYDPNLANRTWESVKIEKVNDAGMYLITFSLSTISYTFKVKPVYEGEDYLNARKKYDVMLAEYDEKRNLRLVTEKNKQRISDSVATQNWKFVDRANKSSSLLAFESIERSQTENTVTRTFQISQFGIYNSDSPTSMPQAVPLVAQFKDYKNNLQFEHVFLIEKGKRIVYNYYAQQLTQFKFNRAAENVLLAVTHDNRIALFTQKQFAKMNLFKPKNGSDTVSFYNKDSVQFVMKILPFKINNPNALKVLING